MMDDRLLVVKALVQLSVPLDSIAARLREYEWDYEGQQVELGPGELVKLLERFLSRQLSAGDLERWANLIEGREDISYERESELLIGEVIHDLANPLLSQYMDDDRATLLLGELKNSSI
jgi:hypothetical protein